VISGFGVRRPFGVSEEMSLAITDGALNVGVFGKTGTTGLDCCKAGVARATSEDISSEEDGAVGLSVVSQATWN
jgi:hypothetical protein